MNISFKSKKLQDSFNSEKKLVKTYGHDQAKKIMTRMKVLEVSTNLEEVPSSKPDRRHQLKGERKDQFAVDLVHPYRLIFMPDSEPEILADGGKDLKKITGIIIIGVEDYHGD